MNNETELQIIDQAGEPLPVVNPWIGIIQSSVEKGADISTIEKFIKLQREEEDRQNERGFNSDFSKLQSLMPEISKTGRASFKTKGGGNMSYNYDQLSDICNSIKPLLSECGLSFSWQQRQENGIIAVQCTLRHKGGHSINNSMSSSPDSSGQKNAIQQIASTVTYLQRYTLKALLGIASNDDDGKASTQLEADKAGASNFASFKASFNANIESKKTIEELTAFKNEAVNYSAKHEPKFCTEIYRKFDKLKQGMKK